MICRTVAGYAVTKCWSSVLTSDLGEVIFSDEADPHSSMPTSSSSRPVKPWKDSTDYEKLDGDNGLLLAPHVDHLFDRASNVRLFDSPDPSSEDSEIVCSCCSTDEVLAHGIYHHTKKKEYKEWVESDEYAREMKALQAQEDKDMAASAYTEMHGPEADLEADIDAMVAAEEDPPAINFDNYYDQTGWWMKDPWDQPGTDLKYGSVP